jgi:hypothetical protein
VASRVSEPRIGCVRFGDFAVSKKIFSHIVVACPEIAGERSVARHASAPPFTNLSRD